MRINKFIANNSKHSRRKADELIGNGKVFINGKKVTEHGIDIDPEKDIVLVDKEIIKTNIQKTYLALNKPADCITTRSDEKNRHTVMDIVPKNKNLKPIGRLDKNTEGLLLFSNDGEFIYKLTHPKFECEKEYFAKISGELSDEDKSKLENGIYIHRKKTAPAKIMVLNTTNSITELKITIHEGRKRQIRKMFASIGSPVKYLRRLRIGNIKLARLKLGQYRYLTKSEINDF